MIEDGLQATIDGLQSRLSTTAARLERFEDAEGLAQAVSRRLLDRIGEALGRQGRARLALAGGRTPLRIYAQLAESPIPWDRVDIVPTSERWVSRLSLERNATLIGSRLLKGPAAAANYIPLIEPWEHSPGHAALVQATARAERALGALGQLDVALLGMGIDGHVASIFTGNPAERLLLDLDGSRNCVLAPARPGGPRQPRISLSLAKIVAARQVLVVVQGERKLQALVRALEARPPVPAVAVLLRQPRTPVAVFWAP